MASNGSSGSALAAEIAAYAQQREQPKISQPNPFCYCHPHCIFTDNHLPPHLQHLLYGQLYENSFSRFPAVAKHMLAWEWPSTFGYAAASCSMNNETYDGASGQDSSHGNVPSIIEYVNQLGDFFKRPDLRHSEQVAQHHYQCKYPLKFSQMSQGSEVHDVYAQTMTYCKDERSNLFGLYRSEVLPPLINKTQALYPHSVPMNHLSDASIFQPGVAKFFAGNTNMSCDDSDMKAPNTELLSRSVNVQSHQGDGREVNCTRETQKVQTGSEQTQFNYSSLTDYAVSPTQGLFHTPELGCPLPIQEGHCFDECLEHHHPRAACSSIMSPMSCLVNLDPIDTAGNGAAQWNGLQPVAAGLWGQVGDYPPRCLQQSPAPAPTQIISTPFPLSSACSTLRDLFDSLQDSSSSKPFPNSGSSFHLSARSAFSCMSSYDYNFSQPDNTLKSNDCHNQYTEPKFTTTHHAVNFSGSQPVHLVSSDENSDNEPKFYPSGTRISTPPSVAGSRQEPYEICQGSSSGMRSYLAENMTSVNDNVSKEFWDCRMRTQVRTLQSATRGRSESAGVRYSYQGSRYGGDRSSPPEFCNLLGQDKNVLKRNSQYAIARDSFNMQASALGLCGYPAFELSKGIAPCAPPTGTHDIHILPVGRTSSTTRQSGLKGQWGAAEDRILSKLVKRYGSRRWSLISTFMANRSGKQCRERWVNHLQPNIRKEGWTTEEEELLVHAHSTFGNRWSAIAKMLPGRTDNSIKNHWHAALRKKDRHGHLHPSLLREYIQKTTSVCHLPNKTFGTLAPPMPTDAEVNNSDACLTDSTNDKKDSKQSMHVNDTTTLSYTMNIVEDIQRNN